MKNFAHKVAVITGAGSGIGRSLSIRLAERGARLALSDIDSAGVGETARMCRDIGARAETFEVDVSDRTAMCAHAKEVKESFGRVNLVVNNAGVSLTGDVVDVQWEDFDWVVATNFWGVVHGTKAFLDDLIESGDGHIVNVSSVFGLVGMPSQSVYSATKFAVRGFSESLRHELRAAGRPVGVTCVHPGGIKTNIVANGRSAGVAMEKASAQRAFTKMALTSSDFAARAILRGVVKNKPRILIGPDARAFDAVPRIVHARQLDALSASYRYARRAAGLVNVRI